MYIGPVCFPGYFAFLCYTLPMASKAGSVFRYFFLDLAGSVIRFPLWWYTTGFFDLLKWIRRSLAYDWKRYDVRLWLENFFVPMYGQRDVSGRLVSVFMRFVVLIGRLIWLALLACFYALIALLWLAVLPLFILLLLQGVYHATFGPPSV